MGQYFNFHFNEPKEALAGKFFLNPNPFEITYMKKAGSSIFGKSSRMTFSLYDGEDYSHWGFYSEMESIFHFKAKSILGTGGIWCLEEVKEKREFADQLDEQGIPFYLLAHTNHDSWVLIRGLTTEGEGIINPNCNTFGLEDSVLGLIKGLDHREHEFAKDYLADN